MAGRHVRGTETDGGPALAHNSSELNRSHIVARTTRSEAGEKKPSQMSMVRSAMEDIGADAKPLAMQAHIKSKFGTELPANIISNYKSQIKRKNGGSGAGGKGRLQVEDFEAIRSLVKRLGADQVKRMVEVVR
jgi:hypothetical protein